MGSVQDGDGFGGSATGRVPSARQGTGMDVLSRLWRELSERPDGPLAFRFYIQPLMAIFFALRDGLRDARAGRPAYFWSILRGNVNRRELLRSGWRSVSRVFVLAVGIDLIYQLVVLRGLRPVEALIVGAVLALVPYVLLRGPANRVARHSRGIRESHGSVG